MNLICQDEEVFAREVSKENWNISSNSSVVGYSFNTYVLSFGYSKKANANEKYTLQDSFGCFPR